MKPIKNLTRFTYEIAAFEGWRLAISISGTPFVKYYSDKKHGSSRKSLAAAKAALEEVKRIAESSKRVNGKLTATSIGKIGAEGVSLPCIPRSSMIVDNLKDLGL